MLILRFHAVSVLHSVVNSFGNARDRWKLEKSLENKLQEPERKHPKTFLAVFLFSHAVLDLH